MSIRVLLAIFACALTLCASMRCGVGAAKTIPGPTTEKNYLVITATNFTSFETNGRVRLAIYWDNVQVIDPPNKAGDPETLLTCDHLIVRVPEEGGKIEDILAEGNVVIVQGGNRATGARAIYRATNDVVELTGNPVLTTAEGTMRASIVELDRANRKLRAKGSPVIMEIKTDAIGTTNKAFFPVPPPDSKK